MERELVDKCFLCQKNDGVKIYDISDTSTPLIDVSRIICPRCGEYKITDDLYHLIDDSKFLTDRYLLSGLVRELNDSKEYPRFSRQNIEQLKDNYPVPRASDVEGKAKKFLERLKARTEYFGNSVEFYYDRDYPLAYAKNDTEFHALLKFLNEKRLVSFEFLSSMCIATLLVDGWTLISNFESKNKTSEQGFIAVWLHESMDKSIDAMEEAITEAGYIPLCIRDEHFSEKIMDKALGEIRKSRFLVVDLTGARNSVFFEAGFAFGLNIDVIYVYKNSLDGSGLPPEFYVRHYQCYKYKDETELKEILKNAISARIKKN